MSESAKPPLDKSQVCSKCPSFLTTEQVPSKFKKSIGAPMCARFGTVLGKPGATSAQTASLQTYVANKCPSYMDEMPGYPVEFEHNVVLPDIEARDRAIEPDRQSMCTSCAQCVNFVSDYTVSEELGWGAGLCAAKGKLLMPNRYVYEARGCEYRQIGPIRRTTIGLHLLPEYEDAFSLNSDPIREYFKNKDSIPEPHEYETDKAVSADEQKSGIRAWRKITDPEGSGKFTHLPIYDLNFFDEIERAKIPRSGDDEHPELYIDFFGGVYNAAIAWTELDETPAIWGVAGIGKTELGRHLAWLMCLPFERFSITASTELDDLAGKPQYSPETGTYFQYGRLPTAWIKPCIIVMDEPNVGQKDVWHFLRPLIDNSKQLVLDMNAGEALKRHLDCYMMFCMNPAWDSRNIGAEPISDADARRLWHISVDIPPPALEREIIKNRVKLDGWEIDDDRLSMIMKIAVEIRGLSDGGTIPISWAIAPQIKVARAMRWFTTTVAYRRAIGDYLEPSACETLLDVVKSHAID